MFKVKYVDSIMMLVRLDLNLIVSLFQHKCEVSETVSTTTLVFWIPVISILLGIPVGYDPTIPDVVGVPLTAENASPNLMGNFIFCRRKNRRITEHSVVDFEWTIRGCDLTKVNNPEKWVAGLGLPSVSRAKPTKTPGCLTFEGFTDSASPQTRN